MGAPSAIGILGGIFDPVHYGHLATAQLARDYFCLKHIFFVPAGVPPHKTTTTAAAKHRVSMLSLAIRNYPGFSLWDGELRRQGPSYTVDTLKALGKEYPDTQLYFIIGSDNLNEVQSWHNYREILSLAKICVAHRPGFSLHRAGRSAVPFAFTPFPSPEWKLSSTLLRTYLATGYSGNGLIPPEVLSYIRKNKLYGT
jgi:nicotinate-nucleotide adenylyltransferase